ncbi:MAG: DNA-3-methyladenine glycosylase I [Bryobacter sp.]|nr:DNA-3-methyladenine glycosylase I [Bryobacter sp.]
MPDRIRCAWCSSDPAYIAYHDTEWGVPSHDERHLFEMLCLEGAQAGLSWLTILKKREGYRRAFDHFDASKMARYTEARKAKLLLDPGIVRNRLKIAAFVTNAQAYLELGSLDRFLWDFVDGRPVVNHWRTIKEVPPSTALSDRISKELKRRGFRFVGSTIIYAWLQAVGVVDDHTLDCWRRSGGLVRRPD